MFSNNGFAFPGISETQCSPPLDKLEPGRQTSYKWSQPWWSHKRVIYNSWCRLLLLQFRLRPLQVTNGRTMVYGLGEVIHLIGAEFALRPLWLSFTRSLRMRNEEIRQEDAWDGWRRQWRRKGHRNDWGRCCFGGRIKPANISGIRSGSIWLDQPSHSFRTKDSHILPSTTSTEASERTPSRQNLCKRTVVQRTDISDARLRRLEDMDKQRK